MKLFLCIKENSQRVLNKNFRLLNDEPLYLRCVNKFRGEYTIYIDTDSDEIIENTKDLVNVFPYKRKKELIGDKVSTDLLIEHFIEKYNIKNETIGHIFTTAPFLTLDTLNKAYLIYKEKKVDSLFSTEVLQKRLWERMCDGELHPINHDVNNLIQTQDLEKYYIENSIFYIFNSDKFKIQNSRICGNALPCIIHFPETIDIDTENDWKICKGIEDYEIN